MINRTKPLDERSRDLLRTLIQIHVETGEPVGSETLARAKGRVFSSATIRNVLADLERAGYLDQPHTSAGRVPTDEGYRVYVDALTDEARITAREAAAISSELHPRDGSPVQVLENASHVLSRLARNAAFVIGPDVAATAFHHVDLVRLPHPRVLVVLVSTGGLVTHRVIELHDGQGMDQDELQSCANYLNAHFSGRTLDQIRQQLLELMREEKAAYDQLLRRVVQVGQRAFSDSGSEVEVYLDGTSHILAQARDVDRLRNLFATFEQKSRLVNILNACLAGDGIRVLIGHENPTPDLADMAVVATSYPLGGERGFSVGVLGSTRMEYGRVIALVGHVGRTVARTLQELSA
jgi:heat-inducible transcriptional repressor